MNDMLLEYIDRMIDQETEHRVFSVDFNNKQYFVKQDISNHRSSWIKPAPRASFDYEFYKISFVNTPAADTPRRMSAPLAFSAKSPCFSSSLSKSISSDCKESRRL